MGYGNNTLDELRTWILDCTKCDLSSLKNRRPVPGWGNPNANIMLIGEAPGAVENKSGKPFVGRSGQLLTNMLRLADIQSARIYTTNVAKCWPDSDKNGKQKSPTKKQMATCISHYLVKELEIVNPSIVIALGSKALGAILPGEKISDCHGRLIDKGGTAIIPMYHPAAAIHQPRLMNVIREDFTRIPELVKRWMDGDRIDVPSELVSPGNENLAINPY